MFLWLLLQYGRNDDMIDKVEIVSIQSVFLYLLRHSDAMTDMVEIAVIKSVFLCL